MQAIEKLLSVAGALVLAGLAGGGSSRVIAAPACDMRCVLVDIAVARESSVSATVTLTGSMGPKFQTNVGFRRSGRLD